MPLKILFSISILLIMNSLFGNAQVYTKVGLSYHTPAFKSTFYDTVQPPSGPIDVGETKHSFVRGIGIEGAIGYQIGKLINAEIGLSYVPNTPGVETAVQLSSRQQVRNYQPNNALFIKPAIGVNYRIKNTRVLVSANVGAMASIGTKIMQDEFVQGNINFTNVDYESQSQIKTKTSFGFHGNIGAAYQLSNLLSIYSNISLNRINIKYDTRQVLGQFDRIQDQDVTDQLSVSEREFIYVDEIGPNDNMDPDQPTAVLSEAPSFSSIAFTAGVKINLGKNKNPIPNGLNKIDNKPAPPPPVAINKPCKDGTVEKLPKHAIKVIFQIPHPSKKAFWLMKPSEKRGKVASAWATVAQAIINAIQTYTSGVRIFKTAKDIRNKKYIAASLKQIGWFGSDDVIGAEFMPSDVGGGSGITAAISFYMRALKAGAQGASGLGRLINKMSVDVYYEIPYIRIEGICTPQKKCIRGKWYPDYNNLTFTEVSRTERVEKNMKKNMTYNDAVRRYENVFKKFVDKLDSHKTRFDNGDRCTDGYDKLFTMKWPIKGDQCAKAEAEVASVKRELKKAKNRLDSLEKVETDWKRKRNKEIRDAKDRIEKRKVEMEKNKAETEATAKLIETTKGTMKNYENAKQTNNKNYKGKADQLKQAQEKKKTLEAESQKLAGEQALDKLKLKEMNERKYEKENKANVAKAKEAVKEKEKKLKDKERYRKYICDQGL